MGKCCREKWQEEEGKKRKGNVRKSRCHCCFVVFVCGKKSGGFGGNI